MVKVFAAPTVTGSKVGDPDPGTEILGTASFFIERRNPKKAKDGFVVVY